MMYFVIGTTLLFILLVALLFVTRYILRRQGILGEMSIYHDTQSSQGEVLYAKHMPLCGKPDSLVKKDGTIIPVEVKTGRTPKKPYPNHVAQLVAYRMLVAENYKTKPMYGIIKYPEREFTIEFEEKHEELVRRLVNEIIEARKSGKEYTCLHAEHQLN